MYTAVRGLLFQSSKEVTHILSQSIDRFYQAVASVVSALQSFEFKVAERALDRNERRLVEALGIRMCHGGPSP